MNYYGAKELAESYRTVRKNTLAIAQDIPADKYSFRPAPDTPSVAELLTHIAGAPPWRGREVGWMAARNQRRLPLRAGTDA